MTREFFNEAMRDNMYVAMRDADIRYTHAFGGGVNGSRTIKERDIVCVTGFCIDVDTVSISTRETVYRIEELFFKKTFVRIGKINFVALRESGYENVIYIPGRGICGTIRNIYTTGLCYGLSEDSYRGRYCYNSSYEARHALQEWSDNQGISLDPPGEWIKHKGAAGEYGNPSVNIQ